MTGLALPFAVEIVGHQVDEIELAGHGRYVVAAVDVVRTDGHGRRQQQARDLQLLRLGLERFAQFCKKKNKNKTRVDPISVALLFSDGL